jgi:phenylacetate-CoA ligase
VFDLPGLTEIAAWGFECDAQVGNVHVHEDYVYPEVLDLETGEPVGPGERGELVFTSLYRKAMPLLRYRTRDVVERAAEPCPCGRTLLALKGGVIGRLDDMKKVRGVIVYPSRVEELVRQHDGIDEFRIIFRRLEGLDDILVRLDPAPGLSAGAGHELRQVVAGTLQVGLGIRTSVEIVECGSLPRWDHKARRIEDQRTEVPF